MSKKKSKLSKTPGSFQPLLAESTTETEPAASREPIPLTEDALYFKNEHEERKSSRELAPPNTPNSDYGFSSTFHVFPTGFPDLKEFEPPNVRKEGVKNCIDTLSSYFGCKEYKFNLLQFWFLDILTDCLWRAQDDFKLPVELQKVALQWILYFVGLLKDTRRNRSRKEFFQTFKEAVFLAAEVIDEGAEIPEPEKLFTLLERPDISESWNSSSEPTRDSLELSWSEQINTGRIEIHNGDPHPAIYTFPNEICECDKFDLSSDEPSEQDSELSFSDLGHETLMEEQESGDSMDFSKFYRSASGTPSRFLETIEGEDERCLEEEIGSKSTSKSFVLKEPCKQEAMDEASQDSSYDVYQLPGK